MRRLGNLAVIGSGPSALYFLNHLLDHWDALHGSLDSVVIFEKSSAAGYGMPYHPETTDRYNRSNISSEELPSLPEKFSDWLKRRDRDELTAWKIEKDDISESEVYCRLALGGYFHDQFERLIDGIRGRGIDVDVRLSAAVKDLANLSAEDCIQISTADGKRDDFDTVVIASGHSWPEDDRPEEGYYSSPWPIFKLLPQEGSYWNFAVGTLGASLSAFDVVSSLSHRHGEFVENDGSLEFHVSDGAEDFEIVMHSSEGWLPHLQWDQEEPMREIYRHVTREELLALRGEDGFLRLGEFFDKVCRPVLRDAFEKDRMLEIAGYLEKPEFGFEEFVEEMSERHDYIDSFEGMRKEMVKAEESVEKHHPIHWKETLDDLMYCLNYHAELLPAEDQVTFRKTVMPFLMNVIAAMPLQSARMLLALHEAGKVRLVGGKVQVEGAGKTPGSTRVTVDDDGTKTEIEYRMFVDCSGQGAMEIDDYPFHRLVEEGAVRAARAQFIDTEAAEEVDVDKLLDDDGVPMLLTGGIDIDAGFRVIGEDGQANPRICDISFPHTSGVRPYSYGLQACNATAGIVVQSWLDSYEADIEVKRDLAKVSRKYDEL
ncbi:MAG: FAD/NAD(P)-binding protein [Luteolibacter sp.]